VIRSLYYLAMGLCVAGCATGSIPQRQDRIAFNAGKSVNGRPIQVVLWGTSGPTIFIIGCIHGNEPAGLAIVAELTKRLETGEIDLHHQRLLIIPQLNPDGATMKSRFNAHGVDLNRNYPSINFKPSRRNGPQPLSEPESVVLFTLLRRFEPAHVIIFHQPLGCIDYDGPAKNLADMMSKLSKLPVRKLGARPGSLGSYVGITLNKPIVNVELPKLAHRQSPSQLWRRYGPMMQAAIKSPPMTHKLRAWLAVFRDHP
jgi:protein MpaA